MSERNNNQEKGQYQFRHLTKFDDRTRKAPEDQIFKTKKDFLDIFYALQFAIEEEESQKEIERLYNLAYKAAENIKNKTRRKKAISKLTNLCETPIN